MTKASAASISRSKPAKEWFNSSIFAPATGVKVQNLGEGDSVVSITKIVEPKEDDEAKIEIQKAPEDIGQTTLNFGE